MAITRYRNEIILIVLLVLLALWCNILGAKNTRDACDIQIAAGILVAIITLYLGRVKQSIEDDKLFKELFIGFNARYDALNDRFTTLRHFDADAARPVELVCKASQKGCDLQKSDEQLIIDYFNLCAEEYLWFKKGRIPKEVWQAWKAGIVDNICSIPAVWDLYNKEIKSDSSKASYYGLVKELEEKLKKHKLN